jgi:hypothetical protein
MDEDLIITEQDEDGEFVISDDADDSTLDRVADIIIPE